MLIIGSGKGRIAAETAAVTGLRCAHSFLDQLPGHQEPSLQQIGMDGKTGLPVKHAHHMILADVKPFCQAVHIQILCQMLIDVCHPFQHPGILGDHRMGIIGILSSALTADLHQQLQQTGIADQLAAVLFTG